MIVLLSAALVLALLGVGWLARVAPPVEEHTPLVPSSDPADLAARAANVPDAAPRGAVLEAPRANVAEPAATVPQAAAAMPSLIVVAEDARGEAWLGAFELWLEHRPKPGSPSRFLGHYREFNGPRAEIVDLPSGHYVGWARSSGRRSENFAVDVAASAKEVHVALLPAGAIIGRVADDAGAPLDAVAIVLSRSGAVVESSKTDAEGNFRFEPIIDGDYELAIGPPLAPLAKHGPAHHVGAMTDLGTISAGALARLAIVVTDADAHPLVGVRVWDGQESGHFDLRTDENGACVARHLPAGQLRVHAQSDEHGRMNRVIRLEAGQETRVELKMPR